jgi:hypothetical protein
VLVAFTTITWAAHGQLGPYSETTSTPIPGGGHDYVNNLNETVDPENGALSVRIVAPAPPERGKNFPLDVYIYDSNGQSVLVPNWASGSSNSLYLSSVNFQIPDKVGSPNTIIYDTNTINTYVGNRFPASCTYWNNYIYTDFEGNRHPLSGLQGTSNSAAIGCQGLGIYASAVGQTGGDGLYTGVYTGPGANTYVYDNDGTLLGITNSSGNQVEDRNGNSQYGSGRSYGFTPSTRTVPSIGGPYASVTVPGLANAYTFTPTVGARGATQPFPFNPTARANQDPSCPTTFTGTIGGYSGAATLSLPNGQQYSKTYNTLRQMEMVSAFRGQKK